MKHLKGDLEHDKKDYGKALSYYTEGIELNCKDDGINAKLYFSRAHSHDHLGELTRFFFLIIYLSELKYLSSKCKKSLTCFDK